MIARGRMGLRPHSQFWLWSRGSVGPASGSRKTNKANGALLWASFEDEERRLEASLRRVENAIASSPVLDVSESILF